MLALVKWIVCVWLWLFVASGAAQDTTLHALMTSSENWQTLSSISNSEISSIELDGDAGIWLGYHNLVQYYDGLNKHAYPIPAGNDWGYVKYFKRLAPAKVLVFFEQTIVLLENGQWTVIADNIGIISGDKAITDSSNRIWFITRNQLGWIEQNQVHKSRVLGTDLRDFLLDEQGFFWLADSKTGDISQFQFANNQLQLKSKWAGVLDPNNTGWSRYRLIQDKAARIWAISTGYYNPPVYAEYKDLQTPSQSNTQPVWQQAQFFDEIDDKTHHAISLTETGEILIIGTRQMYKRDQTGDWQYFPHPFGMAQSFSEKYQLKATGHQLFLLKERFAVKRLNFDTAKITVMQDLIYGCHDDENNRYFISKSGNIKRWQAATNKWQNLAKNKAIISDPVALHCENGRLYAFGGHQNQAALSVFDGRQWATHLYPQLGQLIHFEKILFTKRAIYVGGTATNHSVRLIKLDLRGQVLEEITQTSKERMIRQGPKGIIAVAKDKLYQNYAVSHSAQTLIRLKKGLGWVADVKTDKTGNVWVASWDQGLYQIKQSHWQPMVTDLDNRPSQIANLLIGDQGDVRALSSRGLLSLIDGQWITTRIPLVRVERQNNQILQDPDASFWLNQAGRDWFLRRHGYLNRTISFFSLNYKNNGLAPDTKISLTQAISAGAESVTVKFSAVDYWHETATENLLFSYRVNGHSWSSFSAQPQQTIFGLTQGEDHLIEARAIDQDGNIDRSPAQISVHISIVFWQTLWFKVLCGVVVFVIISLIVLLYVQRFRHESIQEQSKLRFLTQITHELRSPLSMIIGPLEHMNAKLLDSNLQQQAQFALKNSHRLASLIEQILDYRQLQKQNLTFKTQLNDLLDASYSICCNLSVIAEQKNQKLIFISNCQRFKADFNQEAWQKILDNLVINAMKFSPENSHIFIGLFVINNTQVKLLVQDQGRGIPVADQAYIFEGYSANAKQPSLIAKQGPPASLKQFKSYGIGLALVSELVHKMNGRIKVTSPASMDEFFKQVKHLAADSDGFNWPWFDCRHRSNQGCLFSLHYTPEKIIDLELKFFQSQCHSVVDSLERNTVTNNKKTGLKKAHLLIVDDNEALVDYLTESFADAFYISRAENGLLGYEVAKLQLPDVILSDIHMPQSSGLAMCKKLQLDKATAHIPIVLMSSDDNLQIQVNAFISGAIDYISKPLSIRQLTLKVNNLVTKQQRLFDRYQAGHDDNAKNNLFISQVDKLLIKYLANEDFTIDQLAQEMAMSRSAFYRKFKAEIDLSPAEYITQFRLEKAKEKLKDGCSVAEVALSVGYSDSSTFGRIFKKYNQCSPSQFNQLSQ
ncbi:helix-turn-helix domain-containing protein [Gayadomonas joobiniege]|uniref:hybrid sensor histidine kinase/response regulator transcription factor n=1 Tax=Gayadomonas joobiniege TaxID=1234606 RepID=UPI000365E5DB|nr:helix-turn-helix domain-containing protein [Gayadomonas joobiniege]